MVLSTSLYDMVYHPSVLIHLMMSMQYRCGHVQTNDWKMGSLCMQYRVWTHLSPAKMLSMISSENATRLAHEHDTFRIHRARCLTSPVQSGACPCLYHRTRFGWGEAEYTGGGTTENIRMHVNLCAHGSDDDGWHTRVHAWMERHNDKRRRCRSASLGGGDEKQRKRLRKCDSLGDLVLFETTAPLGMCSE